MITVDDMRNRLIETGTYTLDELKKLPKSDLKVLFDSTQIAKDQLVMFEAVPPTINNNQVLHKQLDDMLDSPIINSEKIAKLPIPLTTSKETKNDKTPICTDPDWSDYVLSLFTPKEMDNNNPRTDALRRVAELLLGQFNIFTDVVQKPEMDMRATVVVKLEFSNGRIICGAADVYSGNTDHKFACHAVATAETRAEGRALRKALRLVKVLAAEETYGADKDEPNGISDERILNGMVNSLIVMSDRLGVNIDKLVSNKFKVSSIRDLTKTQGLEVAEQLGKYQRKVEEIGDEIRK